MTEIVRESRTAGRKKYKGIVIDEWNLANEHPMVIHALLKIHSPFPETLITDIDKTPGKKR